MPRPRKPTVLHAISGSLEHDPQRFRDRLNEPKPAIGIGEPPLWLNRYQRPIWRQLAEESAPGVLTRQDRQAFAVLCCLLAQFRALPRAMQTSRIAQMNSLLGQFGMTPAARSRVTVVPVPRPENRFARHGKNPFDEFARAPATPTNRRK